MKIKGETGRCRDTFFNMRFWRDAVLGAALSGALCLGAYLFLKKSSVSPGIAMAVLWVLLAMAFITVLALLFPGWYRKDETKDSLELDRIKQHIQTIQLQKKKEQLNALQSQINPHFLYNTLDTIRGLALEVDAVDVADMVATLSAMFKYSMDYDNTVVTVSDELNQLNSYLRIQAIRFPNRFTFRAIYDCKPHDIRQTQIPKLVLQPIVENIFAHGFKGIANGGVITIRCIATDSGFKIIISDNGVGIMDKEVTAMNRMFRENAREGGRESAYENYGIALRNIDARVKMYLGEQYGLHIVSTPGYGTDVTLELPAPSEEP